MEEPSTTPYELVGQHSSSRLVLVMRTAGPLILAIAGSALTPLPCAFSLTGVTAGGLVLLAIGAANLYTTILMVRAAARCGTSGYEEVMEEAGGAAAAPSPPTAASSDGSGEDALSAFLAKDSLAHLVVPLRDLGARVPADLLDLDEDDVVSLGLKKLELKRWTRAIAMLKSTATASARARTEL